MATDYHAEDKPWQPTIEREPEFNPFANPVDRFSRVENPPLLEDSESSEGESSEKEPVAPASPESAEDSTAALVEPATRQAMIAQAAYFLSERRSFYPGGELDDWLVAEIEIDRVLP